jgi:hypothetical protein
MMEDMGARPALPPSPPSRTKWTRLVPPSRANWTRLVPPWGREARTCAACRPPLPCPLQQPRRNGHFGHFSTAGGTRRVQSVQEGGGGGGEPLRVLVTEARTRASRALLCA